jgi:hypothetical protein
LIDWHLPQVEVSLRLLDVLWDFFFDELLAFGANWMDAKMIVCFFLLGMSGVVVYPIGLLFFLETNPLYK